jgi:uncharacterized protein
MKGNRHDGASHAYQPKHRPASEETMKFLVDSSLGGLAKWLRFCGFDAVLHPLAAAGGGDLPPPQADTYILTCRPSLARLRRGDLLVLTAADPAAQLEEVVQRLGVSGRDLEPLSRCVRCNAPLTPVARDAAAGRAPEYVLHTQTEFFECPVCQRLYWPGSHVNGINRRVLGALTRTGRMPRGNESRQQRSSS